MNTACMELLQLLTTVAGTMFFQTLTGQQRTNLTILWFASAKICILIILEVLLVAVAKLCDLPSRTAFLFVFMHEWGLCYTAEIYVNVVVPYKSKAWAAHTVMFTFLHIKIIKMYRFRSLSP